MKTLQQFIGKKNKISYILRKADKLGFTEMDSDTNVFKTLMLVKDECFEKKVQNKLEYLSINFRF